MRVSRYQAVQMLDAMSKGMLRLSDEMYDKCSDALISLLEEANNQRGAAYTRHAELKQGDDE